jgi:putative DNA methylase
MVDDPSAHPDLFPTEQDQDIERNRLFQIIEQLVTWENSTNKAVLRKAEEEIWATWRSTCAANIGNDRSREIFNEEVLPAFHDPFAGGGALPLEAQRLGLVAHASDLNPVAVLINKAMIEFPEKFNNTPPINPESRSGLDLSDAEWKGASGLADDVRYYGRWIRAEAEKRIGDLYPQIEVTEEMAHGRPDVRKYVGRKLTAIAWLWARTVPSPNPAFHNVHVPLVSSFILSTKKGREAWVDPKVSGTDYKFTVRSGTVVDPDIAKIGTKTAGRGSNFRCLISDAPITGAYIKAEGVAGRMGQRLMAIVVEGDGGRLYLPPTPEHELIADKAVPSWVPDTDLVGKAADQLPLYGKTKFADLYTKRQLLALNTMYELAAEVTVQIRDRFSAEDISDVEHEELSSLEFANEYATSLATYLVMAIDKAADYWSSICTWHASKELIRNTFGRQAIAMNWDFAETNPFSSSTGNASSGFGWVEKVLRSFMVDKKGFVVQADAKQQKLSTGKVVSTDPPYFDNIVYADLSDYFYVWMRRALRSFYPELLGTISVPKTDELVAYAPRHGGKKAAEEFFIDGMTKAMRRVAESMHPAFPFTIYYAFKQSEQKKGEGIVRTGWETFLEAVIAAGFSINGTWPVRTEMPNRMISSGTNALASSIVLVCRPRAESAPMTTRSEFLSDLRSELAGRIRLLQSGNIAPVDLPQSSIGPGMEIFTRYSRVLESNGSKMNVGDALAAINDVLEEVLTEQEGEYDPATRFAISWFEQNGMKKGPFGDADNLARARNAAIDGLTRSGIVDSGSGTVRLLRASELPDHWAPSQNDRITVWEATHRLIQAHDTTGVDGAGRIVALLSGDLADRCKELAYRLYSICEINRWAEDAISYNGLVVAWPEILRSAESQAVEQQGTLI